jgi:hypothetical protein
VAATSQFSRLVDVDDIPLASDSNHFDSAGLQVVGKRFADAYLSIAPAQPPGDFNQDGTVDAADYVVWRKGLGTDYTQDDHNLWRAHYGGAAAGSGATLTSAKPLPAVPEPLPTSFVLHGVIALAACRGPVPRRPVQ